MIGGLVDAQEVGEAGAGAPSERALLALAAQLAALTAVALPACGWGTRAIAFAMSGRIGSPGPWHLAAAQSLADLTVAGLRADWYAVPAYILFLANASLFAEQFVTRTTRTKPPSRIIRAMGRRLFRVAIIAAAVVLMLFGIFVILTGPAWEGLLSLTAITVAFFWIWRIYRKRRSIQFRWTWPILVVCLAAGTVGTAVDYRDIPLGEYSLDSTAGVPSGWYLELGRGSDSVYLLSCADVNGAVLAISPASIHLVQYQQAHTKTVVPPSLLDLLTGRAPNPLGLQTPCP